jgi:predicted metal-dependent HD superfamily phosphohydrolase
MRKILADLVQHKNPEEVWHECLTIIELIDKGFAIENLVQAYSTLQELYAGKYPGYRACNTPYHDIHHISDVTLAFVRLLHSAILKGHEFSNKEIELGVMAALFHDTGYLQKTDDTDGTGAKYTPVHVNRSCTWASGFLSKHGYTSQEIEHLQSMILHTDHQVSPKEIDNLPESIKLVGCILGTADLVGQMADRVYLEKLVDLFHEFSEAKIPGFSSETELYEKTAAFVGISFKRLDDDLGKLYEMYNEHFSSRWGINENLYLTSINNQINYLQNVVLKDKGDIQKYLRRK